MDSSSLSSKRTTSEESKLSLRVPNKLILKAIPLTKGGTIKREAFRWPSSPKRTSMCLPNGRESFQEVGQSLMRSKRVGARTRSRRTRRLLSSSSTHLPKQGSHSLEPTQGLFSLTRSASRSLTQSRLLFTSQSSQQTPLSAPTQITILLLSINGL